MKVRFQEKILRAQITNEYPENTWQIKVFDDNGAIAATIRSREDILETGLQLMQATDLEWTYLSRNGWLPPFDDKR
jgi:hypothetical protein